MSPEAGPHEKRTAASPDATVVIRAEVDLALSFSILQRGPADPVYRRGERGEIWYGCLTPDGPGTLRVERVRRVSRSEHGTPASASGTDADTGVDAYAYAFEPGPAAPDTAALEPGIRDARPRPRPQAQAQTRDQRRPRTRYPLAENEPADDPRSTRDARTRVPHPRPHPHHEDAAPPAADQFPPNPFAAPAATQATASHPAPASLSRGLADVRVSAWGDGAAWLLNQAPAMLGVHDDASGFAELVADHPLLSEAHRTYPGLRVIRTGLVLQSLIPAILEQKVTGLEAFRAWRIMVQRYGTPAPGPCPPGLRVPPPPRAWTLIPSWEWHKAGVDDKRASAIIRAARVAPALERTLELPHEEASRRLRSIPGIGVWTAAETMQRAHGDPDALSVGDYHLAKQVGYALTGERNADDARMLELLAPFQPHRHRAARLVLLAGASRPRRGPRMAIPEHRTR